MNILGFSNGTGSEQWRLRGVANYLNARTKHEYFVTDSKNWNEDTLGADIVVAQMWQNPHGIDVAHKQGAKVVYEADDIIIGVGGGDRKKLMKFKPEQEEQFKETISKADMVTVTTPVLADHYKQFNKNVVILPNYLDFMWWGKPWKMKRRGMIRLGWYGSTSHREDLLMIAPIVKRILDEYDFVKFIYCGTGGVRDVYGEELFETIPPNRREYYSGVKTQYWPQKSKSLGFDIGISPLLDDEFNAGKSPIKYFEYAGNGTPGVYSDTIVYRDTVKHGVTGFLAKNEDDWFNYISKLLLEKDIYNSIVKDGYQDVLDNYSMADHYQKWIKAYQSLL